MPYLAIEKNGDEYIFQNKPIRLSTGWCSFELSAIKLPKKTILKLSGKLMTWKDEPFEMVETSIKDEFYIKVCELSGCSINELFVKTRKREVVQATQFIMAHRKIYLGMSLKTAAAEFGKDHATVIHSIRTIQNLYKTDRAYREQFKDIFNEFPDLLTYVIGEKQEKPDV